MENTADTTGMACMAINHELLFKESFMISAPHSINRNFSSADKESHHKTHGLKDTLFYAMNLKTNQFTHFSESAADILGFSPQEILENGLSWFVKRIPKEDLKRLDLQIDRHCHKNILPHIEYHFQHKNGQFIPLCEYRCVLFDSNHNPSHLIGRINLQNESPFQSDHSQNSYSLLTDSGL